MQAVDSGDFNAMSETHKALHMAIAHAAINSYFVGCCERLPGEGQGLLHLHFDFTVSSPTATKLGRDHADMIDAIARKDADAAEKLAHVIAYVIRLVPLRDSDSHARHLTRVTEAPTSGRHLPRSTVQDTEFVAHIG